VQVDILLCDPSSLLPVRCSLQPTRDQPPSLRTRILSSWAELESRATEAAYDVAIVQPDFPGGIQGGRLKVGSILKVQGTVGAGGLVLYALKSQVDILHDLRRLQFRYLITGGVDNDRRSMLRVVSRAANLRRVQSHLANEGSLMDLADSELLLAPLVGWPPSNSVSDLAERLHVSPRTLRRRMGDHGLFSPKRMIRWGQLLEASALCELGIHSRARLAAILRIRDPSALAHLCQGLTGLHAKKVLGPFPESQLLEIFSSQLKGAKPL
jgi:AraC-like DNA-binding protein